MSARFSFIFFQKKPKNYHGGPIPIYMRVSMDSRRTEISTKRRWDPDCWNAGVGRASGTKEHIRELNTYLDALQNKVYQAHRKLVESGKDLSIQNLKNIIEGKKDKSKMLIAVFQEHNDRVAQLVTKEFATGTLERYITACKHTQEFIRWKYKTDDIEISKLSYEFAADFEFWLKSVRNCCHNTSMK
ncbi:MAG TPA: phage integrase SAM-like domain-containing protein, partial [Chryseolinea sp.]|nr:phage integrase SAM-like domain-containing protein [Chryseolinea sp.]